MSTITEVAPAVKTEATTCRECGEPYQHLQGCPLEHTTAYLVTPSNCRPETTLTVKTAAPTSAPTETTPRHNPFVMGLTMEANYYRSHATPISQFIADRLDERAANARYFGATTPAEYEARRELHEEWRETDTWRDAVSTGYRLARGGVR